MKYALLRGIWHECLIVAVTAERMKLYTGITKPHEGLFYVTIVNNVEMKFRA